MQILLLHPGTYWTGISGVASNSFCFKKPSRGFWCTLKFENHSFRHNTYFVHRDKLLALLTSFSFISLGLDTVPSAWKILPYTASHSLWDQSVAITSPGRTSSTPTLPTLTSLPGWGRYTPLRFHEKFLAICYLNIYYIDALITTYLISGLTPEDMYFIFPHSTKLGDVQGTGKWEF